MRSPMVDVHHQASRMGPRDRHHLHAPAQGARIMRACIAYPRVQEKDMITGIHGYPEGS